MSNPYTETVSAASAAIVSLSHLLTPIGGAAVAIVLVTIAVRLVLHPLTRAAVRGERARMRLAPQVAAIRKKYARNMLKMSEELSSLYRTERISPFAGIMPLLIQAPIVLVLFHAFLTSPSLGGATVFGVPLNDRFVSSASGVPLLIFGVLFAALAAVALITSRRSRTLMKINIAAGTATAAAGSAELIGRIGQFAPFFVLISGALLPLAAGVYVLTTTAWSAAENHLLRRGLPG